MCMHLHFIFYLFLLYFRQIVQWLEWNIIEHDIFLLSACFKYLKYETNKHLLLKFLLFEDQLYICAYFVCEDKSNQDVVLVLTKFWPQIDSTVVLGCWKKLCLQIARNWSNDGKNSVQEFLKWCDTDIVIQKITTLSYWCWRWFYKLSKCGVYLIFPPLQWQSWKLLLAVHQTVKFRWLCT